MAALSGLFGWYHYIWQNFWWHSSKSQNGDGPVKSSRSKAEGIKVPVVQTLCQISGSRGLFKRPAVWPWKDRSCTELACASDCYPSAAVSGLCCVLTKVHPSFFQNCSAFDKPHQEVSPFLLEWRLSKRLWDTQTTPGHSASPSLPFEWGRVHTGHWYQQFCCRSSFVSGSEWWGKSHSLCQSNVKS